MVHCKNKINIHVYLSGQLITYFFFNTCPVCDGNTSKWRVFNDWSFLILSPVGWFSSMVLEQVEVHVHVYLLRPNAIISYIFTTAVEHLTEVQDECIIHELQIGTKKHCHKNRQIKEANIPWAWHLHGNRNLTRESHRRHVWRTWKVKQFLVSQKTTTVNHNY